MKVKSDLLTSDHYWKFRKCFFSFKAVKKHFLSFFAQWGHVKEIKTDNGPPWKSTDWEEFAKQEGFYPRRVTPLHPTGNSEAEQLMKLVKKTLQLCKLYGYAFEEEIQRQLFSFRATPSTTTGRYLWRAVATIVLMLGAAYAPLNVNAFGAKNEAGFDTVAETVASWYQ